MTLETALVMPLVLGVVLTVLFFCLHVYNRTIIALSCGEQAVSGHKQETPVLYSAGEAEITREESKSERTVKGEAETLWYTEDGTRRIREESSYRKVKPVSLMRRAYAVLELAEGE